MSDDEWARWKASYQRGGRAMPNVLKRAKTDRRNEILGFIGLYAIAGAEVVWVLHGVVAARTPMAVAVGRYGPIGGLIYDLVALLVTATAVAAVVGAHVSMRGTFRETGATPLDLLEALERRHAGRRRLLRFILWPTGFVVMGVLVITALAMAAVGRFDPATAGLAVGGCGFTVGFVELVRRWMGRRLERDLEEVAEARRLLAEEDEQG